MQRSLAEYDGFRKRRNITRGEAFLSEMEQVVPWSRFETLIAPHDPAAGRGRKPYPLSTMLRLRPAHRDPSAATPRREEWCLIEWPIGEAEPTRFWLSTLPANTSLTGLVHHAMLRGRIERDHQEMKQEIGLGHDEGRGWRGFHHHATLCIAA